MFSLVNYQYLFTSLKNLPIYMRNGFVLAFGTAIVQVLVSSLAGYAFARMQSRFRDVILYSILVSLFVPRGGSLMALYELMNFLHLHNSIFGLILLCSSTVTVLSFIMRQTFRSLPKEIEECALIHGANWLQVFSRIAMPMAAGGTVVIAMPSLIGVWSDSLITYTLVDRDTQMTISVGVRKLLVICQGAVSPRFRGQFAQEAADSTMLLVAALPVIIFHAVFQRWMMKGLMERAVKL